MRLAQFITRNIETILEQWEAFAATRLPAAEHMKPLELRDHAKEILQAIAIDLSMPQTGEEQAAKSKGLAPGLFRETAAQAHAMLRAKSGFDIKQLASEYRALRASVLRLWTDTCPPEASALDDVMRFNEAIDQALAESIGFFSAQVEQSRNLLLGMLGHDMRNPLQTIQMTAQHLARLNSGPDISKAAARLISGGAQMQALLDDLMDFSRSQLGLGIRVRPSEANLEAVCVDEVEQVRAAHPGHEVQLEVSGDCRGEWDGRRVQQLLRNLTVNAIKYGAGDKPVRVAVTGLQTDVRIEVRNEGPAIDRATLANLFQPLTRGADEQRGRDDGLGLGLYIANEIAKAHGGAIEVRSDDAETVFAVTLPRRRQEAPRTRNG
jgi:signal transduction histidine kinase